MLSHLKKREDEIYAIKEYIDGRGGVGVWKHEKVAHIPCPITTKLRREYYGPKGRLILAEALLDGRLKYTEDLAEIIYKCLLCGACEEKDGIDVIGITEAMRADIVESGLAPNAIKDLGSSIETNCNPYGQPPDERMAWMDKLKFSVPKKADNVLFVGCTAAYRRREIAASTSAILQRAGIDFAILNDEWCCGLPLLQTGHTKLALKMVNHTVTTIKESGAKRVICLCPGCYDMIKLEYPKIIGQLPCDVIHTTELIDSLIEEGKIKLTKGIKKAVTYHDPCHLVRHINVYDPPRNILNAIPELEFIEMTLNLGYLSSKQADMCCSGYTLASVDQELAIGIATDKFTVAEESGATSLVSACPSCKTMFLFARSNAKKPIEIYDISELVAESMEL